MTMYEQSNDKGSTRNLAKTSLVLVQNPSRYFSGWIMFKGYTVGLCIHVILNDKYLLRPILRELIPWPSLSARLGDTPLVSLITALSRNTNYLLTLLGASAAWVCLGHLECLRAPNMILGFGFLDKRCGGSELKLGLSVHSKSYLGVWVEWFSFSLKLGMTNVQCIAQSCKQIFRRAQLLPNFPPLYPNKVISASAV